MHFSIRSLTALSRLSPYTSKAIWSRLAHATNSRIECPAPAISDEDAPSIIDSAAQVGLDDIGFYTVREC